MRQRRLRDRSPTRRPVQQRRRCYKSLQERWIRGRPKRPRKPRPLRPATKPQETPKPRLPTSPRPRLNPAPPTPPRPRPVQRPTHPRAASRTACPSLRPMVSQRRRRLPRTKRAPPLQLPPKNPRVRPGPPRPPRQKWVRRKPRGQAPTEQSQ